MEARPTFKLENYRTLQSLVYRTLREAILDGQLAPGQKLVAGAIARDLGVSRMPVREALSRLEQDGFVTSIPHKEVVVAEFNERDVIEIYDIRSVLEAYAARLCAQHVTPAQLCRLGRLLAEMEAALADGDTERFKQRDNEFHHLLFATCGSLHLARLLSELWDQCLYYRSLAAALNTNPGRSVEHHRQILLALERRDPDAAEKWIQEHTQTARERIVAHLRSRAGANIDKEA